MKVHCLVFNGFSDWEPAFILPELRQNSVEITTLGFSKKNITSRGGLKIQPERSLEDLSLDEVKYLIIPGGALWEEKIPESLCRLVQNLHASGCFLAAICGATLLLSETGLLNTVQHTSNALDYLKHFSSAYKGETFYRSDLAVYDGNIVTASGVGALEFAKEILAALKIYPEEKIEYWYNLFKYAKY